MQLLIIDTATEACSVALVTANGTVVKRFEICPQQHSQRLLPMVDEVLKEGGVTLGNLDGLAFGRGPGSFTGVRIATGMIQGLALGSSLNVAQVSTLEAMAWQAREEQNARTVVAAIDARMDEVYFAVFSFENGGINCIVEEQVVAPADAAEKLPSEFVAVGTGWDAYDVLGKAVTSAPTILYPQAAYMKAPAISQFNNGNVVAAAKVEPVYLRDKVTWKKLPGRE